MKKVLFICNVIGHIKSFHIPYIKLLQEKGCEVHVITNAHGEKADFCDKLYDVDLRRSPFDLHNIPVLLQIKKIIDREKYDLVHCHTPMGGVAGRLCSISIRKSGSKVLYTSHGFHFFKGAPLAYWLTFFPVEYVLSKITDGIITINDEDYKLAKNYFESGKTHVYKIDGIGVDLTRFRRCTIEEKIQLRYKMGYGKDDVILIYVAELSDRKNHQYIIPRLSTIKEHIPQLKVLFAGSGNNLHILEEMAVQNGVADFVEFLGYRNDIPELMKISDLLVSSSKQEGLPINVVEGMASGLPVVASNIRGHSELVVNGENGYLFEFNDNTFTDKICKILEDDLKYNDFSELSIRISQRYSLNNIISKMKEIYEYYSN